MSPGRFIKLAGVYSLLLIGGALTVLPFVWMALTSLQPMQAAIETPLQLLNTAAWSLGNYEFILRFPELPIVRMAFNSIVVTVTVVLFQLTICSLAAYAFARLSFRGRESLFILVTLTMMVPTVVMIVPLFITVERMGLLDTYAGLILPYPYLSTAFGIFLLRQHFMSIPRSLDEAAELDGCSKLGILWHVILPSSKPALATLAAFGFIWTWTDFYWPLLATSTREMRTLEVGLSMFKESYGGNNWPIQMAAAVIVLLPAMAFFLALQRYFVKGVVHSGLKG